jgi:hypothetical protein
MVRLLPDHRLFVHGRRSSSNALPKVGLDLVILSVKKRAIVLGKLPRGPGSTYGRPGNNILSSKIR